jgi:hypothetical protein
MQSKNRKNKLRSLIAFIVISAAFLAFSGCSSECWSKPGSKGYREIVETISTSNVVAVKKFSELSVDDQITVALYARYCPDDPRIFPMLVRDGEGKIASIVERIKKEEKLWDKGELVLALMSINTKCRCILRDSETIQTLERLGRELDQDASIAADDTYKNIYHGHVTALKEQLND